MWRKEEEEEESDDNDTVDPPINISLCLLIHVLLYIITLVLVAVELTNWSDVCRSPSGRFQIYQ